MDLNKMDANARNYFNTLPPTLQEQIMQSGACIETREDLENYCKNSLEAGNSQQ